MTHKVPDSKARHHGDKWERHRPVARPRPRRPLRVVGIVLAVLLVISAALAAAPQAARAYDINPTGDKPTGTAGGRITSLTSASGITTTVTLTGATYVNSVNATMSNTTGSSASLYTPQPAEDTPSFHFKSGGPPGEANDVNCYAGQTCPTGSLTVTFSQPVRDPILHVFGLGSSHTSGTDQTRSAGQLTINPQASSPGVTLGAILPGATDNLRVSGGTIGVHDASASPNCDRLTDSTGGPQPARALAGCGSVQLHGVMNKVSFETDLVVDPDAGTGAATPDGYGLIFTFDQHYSDAPASYNGTQAPAAVVGDLALGQTVVANATSAAVPTASPYATTGIAVNSTAEGEDALPSWPALSTAQIGSAYSVTVPISGASQSGQVCGYIDFTRAGNFDAPSAKACADFVAGQTSVDLTWTVPEEMTAGETYARLRANYCGATSPTGLAGVGEVEDYFLVIEESVPAISLVKTASSAGEPITTLAVGQTVDYEFSVTNAGNVALANIAIQEEAFTGSGPMSSVQCPGDDLAPGETTTCRATYVVTQADVDRGGLTNTATASAIVPGPPGTITSDPDTVTIPVEPEPALRLVKTGGLAAGTTGQAGDQIDFGFAATNTGNVTLTSVVVSDPLPGLTALTFDWPGEPGVLGPGQTTWATAVYTLTEADIDAGAVTNRATATGLDPDGDPIDGDDTVTVDLPPRPVGPVELPPEPGIQLAKTGGLTNGGSGQAGDTVEFSFSATNTGKVALSSVTIDDPMPGLTDLTYDWPGEPGVLGPGQTVKANAAYVVTQDDVHAGLVFNKALALGLDPDGTPVDDTDTTTVTITPVPGLTLTKTGALAAGQTWAVGGLVEYRFAAANTGNVNLVGVAIHDALPGLSSLTYDGWPQAEIGLLEPGDVVTATAQYRLTAQDVAYGSVTNVAKVTATTPDGSPVEASSTTVVVTGLPPSPKPHPLAPLPAAGAPVALGTAGLAILLIGLGAALIAAGQRRDGALSE